MTTLTTHQHYIDKVKTRYGRTTPFRLGMEVGRAGDTLASPYEERTQAHKLYMDGLQAGKEMLERKREQSAMEGQGREFP